MRRMIEVLMVLSMAACSGGVPWTGSSPVATVPSASASPLPATTTSEPAVPGRTTDPSAAEQAPGVLAVAANVPREDVTEESRADARRVADGDTEFALTLFRHLAAESRGNVVLGPGTISTALSMVLAGARGETAAELRAALHALPEDRHHAGRNALDLFLASRNREGLQIRMANQVWAQDGVAVDPGYAQRMSQHYGAPTATLDFASDPEAARAAVNGWVARRTRERIPELFRPGQLDPSTVMVLVSAVAFDGQWRYVLDGGTGVGSFQLADGTTTPIAFMTYNHSLPSGGGEGWQAVELPYVGEELSMVIVVPDDLARFERGLDRKRLEAVVGAIDWGGIHLSLPRFSVRHRVDLPGVLGALGIKRAFDPGRADFTGMLPAGGVSLDDVVHEAYVKIDEKGTEAAAATGADMPASHGPTVTVDRPFLFFIRERTTGAILFLGRVADPGASD